MTNEPNTKDKLVTVRVSPDKLLEFKIAAGLKGATMSGLIHQFVVATIWDEKKKHPDAFANLEQVDMAESVGDEPKRTPTKTNSGSLKKPKRVPDFDRTQVFAKTGRPMTENDEKVILDDIEKEEEEEGDD